MSDYLMRDQAPLSADQWEKIDNTVVEVARQVLVGRRFIHIYGPLGAGVRTILLNQLGGIGAGVIDVTGETEAEPVHVADRKAMALLTIHRDFRLLWQDIEASKQFGLPLDTSTAAAAAYYCAMAEDDLVLNGTQGHEGLLTATGRTTLPMKDWAEQGNAFADVVAATAVLQQAGFGGPYVLVVSPKRYADMNRLYGNSGRLELNQVRNIATEGVYQSRVMPDNKALVVSVGVQNLDLAIAQDLITAYAESSNLNHTFRVFEVLALRIKRPGAICTLEMQ
jgi:uncharacterized linocin/CFP29 family protein